MDQLFGNEIKPACKYCSEALHQLEGGLLLCMKKGAVQPEHSCRRFLYDPLKRVPPRPQVLEVFDGEDFSIQVADK